MKKALGLALALLVFLLAAWWLWPRSALRPGTEEQIENLMEQAIRAQKMPGAVVLIGHRGRVIYRRAFGFRSLEPVREPMTVDTIFDLSSLTKVLATATSIMLLAERGQLLLSDPLKNYVSHLRDPLAGTITLEQLLTHTSGYASQLDLSRPWEGREGAYAELRRQVLLDRPGTRFRYSDINYIALGFVVEKVAEQDLASFTHDQLWVPLGISETTRFCPPEGLSPIAPTEWRNGKMLRGSVHGPQAARMGGIAGNGGLFSRADDLARYCQMILDGGRWRGRQILGTDTLARMVRPVVVSEEGATRGLGWDLDSALAVSRGDFFPRGSFGHTGYAGSSIWIDPTSQTYVVFLSNMVHPRGRGNVREVRARLFSLVAAGLLDADPQAWSRCEEEYAARLQAGQSIFNSRRASLQALPPISAHGASQNGLEVLAEQKYEPLRGRRNGVVGSAATLQQLRRAGLQATPLHSPAQLKNVEQIVLDLPSPQTRFDPQIGQLREWMKVAAQNHLPMLLLDHPCWLGGEDVQGPVPKGPAALPIQPAMTLGELAGWFQGASGLQLSLRVIPVQGWSRLQRLEGIEALYEPANADLDSLESLLLQPALTALGHANLSIGLGTPRPFGWIGAPWVRSEQLTDFLNRQSVPGVRFSAHRRRPDSGAFAGQTCEGADVLVVDRSQLDSQRLGLEIGLALRYLYPRQWRWSDWISTFQDQDTVEALQAGSNAQDIVAAWQAGQSEFRSRRRPYLLYK